MPEFTQFFAPLAEMLDMPKWAEGGGIGIILWIAYRFYDRNKQSQIEAAQANLASRTHEDESERKDFGMVSEIYTKIIKDKDDEIQRLKKELLESYEREEKQRQQLRLNERSNPPT